MKSSKFHVGWVRHSVRAASSPAKDGAHGVTRPTSIGGLKLGASLVLGCWCLVLSAHAQYAINWFKVAGGGGPSTGAQYAVTGTLGQHDAGGPMTNAQYSILGGFWVLPVAVPQTNAPTLAIAPAAPGLATVSWTPRTPGFVLQENLNLGTTNWGNSVSGATNPVVVPATPPQKFYRLFKP